MSDIVIKLDAGRDIVHGGSVVQSPVAITGAEKVGTNYSHTYDIPEIPATTGELQTLYTNRYDNSSKIFQIDISAGGTGTVPAVPNKQIEVSQYTFLTDSAAEVSFLSDSTFLVEGMQFMSQGGITANNDEGVLRTSVGEALNIVSTSGSINGNLTYRYK